MLRQHHPQVIEFRASIVIGSGSLSFEMIRALVERLPVMICPRWVQVKAQPIAVEDLLAYLLAALDLPAGPSQVYEIGGPDQVSYGQIMQEYARQRGLTRWMIPVPLLTPYLSSLWLGLVTPLYARVGRKLVESLRNPTLVSNNLAARTFSVRPRSVREAIARALVNEDREFAETRWSDALSAGGPPRTWGGVRFGSRLVDSRTVTVPVPPEQAFAPIRRIGGRTGWYYGNWLWSLRGFLDLLFGGVGVRRGRRDPENLRVGDALDFWRVEVYEPPHRLRLHAEMKLPGRAWLEFEVTGDEQHSTIRQTAIFDPVGLVGLAVLVWDLPPASVRVRRHAAESGAGGRRSEAVIHWNSLWRLIDRGLVDLQRRGPEVDRVRDALLGSHLLHLVRLHALHVEIVGDDPRTRLELLQLRDELHVQLRQQVQRDDAGRVRSSLKMSAFSIFTNAST